MVTATVKADPFYRNHLIRDGIGRAIHEEMQRDSSIYLFGEGAHMKIHFDHPEIERDFADRVVTMPICEDGSTNFAVGASLLGVKPVVDVITADFLYRTMDSICNTAAKLNFVTGEDRTMVIRSEFLIGGPTTGQRPEALFTHIPGLNVVIPSTPRDAYGLMRTALRTPGVTLFFEDRMIKDEEINEIDQSLVGFVGLGHALQRWTGGRDGRATVISYGICRQITEAVIEGQRSKVDFFDLRSIYPIDWSLLHSSLKNTKKLLIIEPDVTYAGIGAEIAATVAEWDMGVKVKRLGAPKETIPASMALHERMLPSEQEIINAINSF
ncbi:MAG: transketolase C-terminal domain-containing protein [Dehalococcoidia bacterium]